jgi:exonuclease VII large subunit
MGYNPDLAEALDYEQKEVGMNLESMMSELLDSHEIESGHKTEIDEMSVRRMTLALRYLAEEEETLKRLKEAVMTEWDRRIKEKQDNAAQIKRVIEQYIKEENKGKALKLDVGTVSLRKVKANFTAVDKNRLRAWLNEKGLLDRFIKPAEIDATLAKNYILSQIEQDELSLEDLPEGIGDYRPEEKSVSIRFK